MDIGPKLKPLTEEEVRKNMENLDKKIEELESKKQPVISEEESTKILGKLELYKNLRKGYEEMLKNIDLGEVHREPY
ncbi:hypothetical protein A2483_00335 [Candidatus Peregrinibacteria bacterium RIFOXYC2_FULL_33_13]|nr:MAG: hypothetical protein UR27_C0019G0013 [Candidatus Peregrinibacteria bacterium GW2011_GWA2_33_10]KKP39931.1 MAG: hypothetical protein UR30_C0007G0032 [Candidatus Peregrinibacteria bacterium GW2011_GWC2_33_13]OGJ48164.1 MAG: hypothetical protein A2229_03940 [Candidatus Peregrinibacteria bacterium RIFOXYA2_FULL_33_7]OGJ53529.1 MAG: hypothetical protein A2483_00335 [Candidatus Peregrinibacteria bacterium RIFOXYC2_FULL_33_13]